jgi:hypothetical protein
MQHRSLIEFDSVLTMTKFAISLSALLLNSAKMWGPIAGLLPLLPAVAAPTTNLLSPKKDRKLNGLHFTDS